MAEHSSLTNHFLIAMPALADPNFSRTVTYVCEHNEEGALGIVINRPSDLRLGELFEHMEMEVTAQDAMDHWVYMGGPVQRERGFVLHSPEHDWEGSLPVSEEIYITTSRDVLEALAHGRGPKRFLVALGYAGWGPGQLEEEMANNAWLSGPADADIVFEHSDDERWQAAAALLGVDLRLISSDAGHA